MNTFMNESSANSILDVKGAQAERAKLRKDTFEDQTYQEALSKNLETWKDAFLQKHPKLNSSECIPSIEEAIKQITFIDWFSRNKLREADAPLLQPRDLESDDQLVKTGIEDLIEKFSSGDLEEALNQVTSAVEILDNSAFSASHNIHLGLVPLYIIREEAFGLMGHLRFLLKKVK